MRKCPSRIAAHSLLRVLGVIRGLQKQQLQIGAAGRAGGGEIADKGEGFGVVAQAAGGGPFLRREQGGAEVRDE